MHELPYFYSYYWSTQQQLSGLMMAFQFQRILRIIYLKKSFINNWDYHIFCSDSRRSYINTLRNFPVLDPKHCSAVLASNNALHMETPPPPLTVLQCTKIMHYINL